MLCWLHPTLTHTCTVPIQNPGLGFLFTNVHGKATAAAYSPDGAYMAVGGTHTGFGGVLLLLCVPPMQPSKLTRPHCFSPFIVDPTDESGTVFVLRSSDGSVLFEHKNIVGGSVTGIAFHADGKTFCAGGTNKP